MTDIVERLRDGSFSVDLCREAADEIERLRELIRSQGANRYWEARWRDEAAANNKLQAAIDHVRSRSVPAAEILNVFDGEKYGR